MITKEELDRALGDAEIGKKLRLTFPQNCLMVSPLNLRTFLGLGGSGVIEFDFYASIRLLGAVRGDGWGGKPVFEVAIGPNFPNYRRQSIELLLLGCLEKIEAM